MPIVSHFCCFRLHTAGIILGWIDSVASLLNIIIYTVILARLDEIIKNTTNNDSSISEESAKTMALTVLSIYITINAIDCVASVLLIAGTMKERHLMIVPWLINCGVSLTFNIINFVIFIILCISHKVIFAAILLVTVVTAVFIGIQIMAWLSMYSLFKVIQMSSEQHQRLIPNKNFVGVPSYTRI